MRTVHSGNESYYGAKCKMGGGSAPYQGALCIVEFNYTKMHSAKSMVKVLNTKADCV